MERLIESLELMDEQLEWMQANPWSIEWLADKLKEFRTCLGEALTTARDEALWRDAVDQDCPAVVTSQPVEDLCPSPSAI